MAKSPRRPAGQPERSIRVRGAREHNLRSIDVDIPRDQLVVVTGLSGSGKSSLAFDTIFAEGQRKYMESLSAYARQFLQQLSKPDIDDIEGLPPTIAIEQRSSGHNPRSTVATSTEIYDYLRLLYARCGAPTCWKTTRTNRNGAILARCSKPIEASGATQIVDAVMDLPAKTRLMALSPVVRGKKGHHKDVAEDLQKQGFIRARIDGDIRDLREALKEGGENPLNLGRYERHSIEAVVDRLVMSADVRSRLADSVETALKLGEGVVIIAVEEDGDWTDRVFSEKHACAAHPECALEELEPRLFSFNSPYGACPACDGLGTINEFDEAIIVPDETLSLSEGAIKPWAKKGPVRVWFSRRLKKFCKAFGASYTAPLKEMKAETRQILIHGASDAQRKKRGARWKGVLPMVQEWWQTTESPSIKEWLSGFLADTPCSTCQGARLRIEALSVLMESGTALPDTVVAQRRALGLTKDPHQVTIADFTHLNISTALAVARSLKLSKEQLQIAEPILREIGNRLTFLESVGLDYLSLDRKMGTLSGGEAQRIRLATQIGSGLVGSCYVLDEPTIGLHQKDNDRLIGALRRLTNIGNTVIVVEHDEDMIRSADHIVDVGPGPGVHGGRIVAQGTAKDIIATPESLTGQYLSGSRSIETPTGRRKMNEKSSITVKGARHNNLKSIDVNFPLGGIICVTGVSGSGKSTLVNDILLQAVRKKLYSSRVKIGEHTRVTGLHRIDRVIEVDQSPIGRTPRSNSATYTNVFDEVRKVFTKTKEAKIRGYLPGRFSFNVKGGRCEACQGQGVKKIEMHFLPDVFVECEVCQGARYNRETLEVTYRGRTIADVLRMTVEDACEFFENHPKILRIVECLRDVGLDYIQLGQPSTTLSGGEAQRIKLAAELSKGTGINSAAGHTLYILDEPTTGLHFEDIRKLMLVLNQLADRGNTLVVIEHNLDVIKCADWIIDLGPQGGDRGGTVVASGTPEDVARTKGSYTGEYLAPLVKTKTAKPRKKTGRKKRVASSAH